MKTKYRYIHFRKQQLETHKRPIWDCISSAGNSKLGDVSWNPRWRQFCYYPTVQAVYSASCLDDISDFIGQLDKQPKIG